MTKNDIAWETLFERHKIVEKVDRDGLCSISSAEINKEREARLMTKFDHHVNLPSLFKKNRLAILPDSRSSYVIGRFNCYAQLPSEENRYIEDASLPTDLESISATDLYSEPSALLCAQHAGLLSATLEESMILTVFGRMTTGQFDFSIRENASDTLRSLQVKNAQCEVDGGYEGTNAFALIEAKNLSVEDFHIRQLYYPYRLWVNKLSKPVIPVFFTYSNEVFSFYVYQFAEPNIYNSLELIRAKHYQIVPTEIELADVRRILDQIPVLPEPIGEDGKVISFPQADSFERIIDILTRLQSVKSIPQEEITSIYAFTLRQTQYYVSAINYLGLSKRVHIRGEGVSYVLSDLGAKLMQKQPRTRNLKLMEIILSRQVFRDALEYYLAQSTLPPNNVIEELMNRAKINVTGTTFERRASTVRGWIRWLMNLTKEG